MRAHLPALASFLAFVALGRTATVHLDISHHVDVVVDSEQSRAPQANHHCEDKPKLDPIQEKKQPPAQSAEDYLVDLGSYQHRGFPSSDGKFIKFSNIPYAEPPTGQNRFSYPQPYYSPDGNTQDGTEERICPQAVTGWFPKATEFLKCYGLTEAECNLKGNWTQKIEPQDYPEFPPKSSIIPPELKQDEDCLLLDVYVPESVWKNKATKKVSILTWIHGGGFVLGWKSQVGSPAGLFQVAAENGEDPFIFVTINYRLGAFGWSGGDYFRNQGGTPNAGLRDQAQALYWIQDFIEEFGGDKESVTVMGESAGASSILHHITSYAGDEYSKPPFSRAILQSPAFFPQPDGGAASTGYLEFQFSAGSPSLYHLRGRDRNTLNESNARAIYYSNYGTFKFGPTVDHDYVPELPGKLLKEGKYHRNISIITGHSLLDGLLFAPPWIRNDSSLTEYISSLYPRFDSKELEKIKTLYPIDPKGDVRFNQTYTAFDLLDDVAISCNNVFLSDAAVSSDKLQKNPTYRYLLAAPPAPVHGLFPFYVFYPADGTDPPSMPGLPSPDKKLARFVQRSFVNFVTNGNPSRDNQVLKWPTYKITDNDLTNRRVLRFGALKPSPNQTPVTDIDFMRLPKNIDRCPFWEKAPFTSPEDLVTQKPGYQWEL